MKILVLLALSGFVTLAAHAGEQRLFNGKDLEGWDAAPGWWRIEDGALTAESTPDKPCKKSVNGVLMSQVTDHRADIATPSGVIGLQMHPGPPMKVQFRNIVLKTAP